MKTHTCAATGCQHQIPTHLLMCMDHWRMVPVALRRAMVWRDGMKTPLLHENHVPQRQYFRYQDAVAAAVAAVAGKQTKKNSERAEVLGDLFAQPTDYARKQLSKEEHGNTVQQSKQ